MPQEEVALVSHMKYIVYRQMYNSRISMTMNFKSLILFTSTLAYRKAISLRLLDNYRCICRLMIISLL